MLAGSLAAGCGTEPYHPVPLGCLKGPSEVRAALSAAPGQVRVGGRRLSECFPRGGTQADVENVGAVFITAAERLADQTLRRPNATALTRLGFLIGAAHRGTAHAQGIYSELLRRLDSILGRVDTRSAAFVRGRAAGAQHG